MGTTVIECQRETHPVRRCGHVYPARAIHLIDVENLVGAALPDVDQIRDLRDIYASAVRPGADDHVIVATSHLALKKTGAYWPGARYLARSGRDGADLALLDVIRYEHVAERFTRVTIASGDGVFAQAAAALSIGGCYVTVVSRRNGLSPGLALAARRRVIYLDIPGIRRQLRSGVCQTQPDVAQSTLRCAG